MEVKTTMNILDDWDEYKDKNINFNEDWTEKHDNYLNRKWVAVDELIKHLEKEDEKTNPEDDDLFTNGYNTALWDLRNALHNTGQ